MPHKAEPADGFQQPNYQTNKVVHENEADNDNVKRSASRVLKLSEDPACAADVSRICGKITGQNNFAVIDCLQNDLMVSRIAVLPKQSVMNELSQIALLKSSY